MNQLSTHCEFCTTVLCKGCKQKIESNYQPFFKEYKPYFYFQERKNYLNNEENLGKMLIVLLEEFEKDLLGTPKRFISEGKICELKPYGEYKVVRTASPEEIKVYDAIHTILKYLKGEKIDE